MKMLLAIDPGPAVSAWVLYDGTTDLWGFGIDENDELLRRILWDKDIAKTADLHLDGAFGEWLAIENVSPRIRRVPLKPQRCPRCSASVPPQFPHAFFGQPAETKTMETMYWVGRFSQAFGTSRTTRIERLAVKKSIAGSGAAKDSDIRRALIQLWFSRTHNPEPHRKGGKLFKVSKDIWSALAIAVTWWNDKRPFILSEKLPESMRESTVANG